MEIQIFGYRVEINVYHSGPWDGLRRRKLARRVDAMAHDQWSGGMLKIARIKAIRAIVANENCGFSSQHLYENGCLSLKAAKDWVEVAFLDNGYGSIA